jgi:hypothetical protein
MKNSAHGLLLINRHFFPRGGTKVVFLEQNRTLEGAAASPKYVHAMSLLLPDGIELGPNDPEQFKLLQAIFDIAGPSGPPGLWWSLPCTISSSPARA